ncbi:MAG: response regulator transcription factor [Dehalococcoidia bacterium]
MAAELTSREIEVLKLVAGGLPNVQIADELVVSVLTVQAHISPTSIKRLVRIARTTRGDGLSRTALSRYSLHCSQRPRLTCSSWWAPAATGNKSLTRST